MWECQFRDYCKRHPAIYDIIYESRPNFTQRHRGAVTAHQILSGIRSGELFGMVEVDIQVPHDWCHDRISELSPKDYFGEMCPLFCNSTVTFDDVGKHAQSHIREQGLSDAPRRLLLGGMKARQILLATPLLKWYLEHGLIVTKLYQVVEFRRQACFKRFVKDVSDARRAGDSAPELSIIADTNKLIGNSAYGSLIYG